MLVVVDRQARVCKVLGEQAVAVMEKIVTAREGETQEVLIQEGVVAVLFGFKVDLREAMAAPVL